MDHPRRCASKFDLDLTYSRLKCVTRLAEEEEKQFQIDRANFAAKSALSRSQMRKGSSGRGGRGGGRSGRGGGRHGGGDREKTRDKAKGAPKLVTPSESQTGEKRKRAVEPDGGPDVGVRGGGVPTIAASKKAKADES